MVLFVVEDGIFFDVARRLVILALSISFETVRVTEWGNFPSSKNPALSTDALLINCSYEVYLSR